MSLFTKVHTSKAGPSAVSVIDPEIGRDGCAIAYFSDRGTSLVTAQRNADAFIAADKAVRRAQYLEEVLTTVRNAIHAETKHTTGHDINVCDELLVAYRAVRLAIGEGENGK